MNTVKRVLITAPSWVGDMVMAQSLFITLKQQYKNIEIDVIAPSMTLPLLSRMPEVNSAIELKSIRGQLNFQLRYQLGRSLQNKAYDQAILLPNTWKSGLIPLFANIPQRTGYLGEYRWGLLNDIHKLDRTILTKTVQRFVALAKENSLLIAPDCPIPHLQISLTNQQRLLAFYQLELAKPILALCPGAEYGMAKRWPVEYYAEIANVQLKNEWQIWLLGSKKDSQIAAQINQLTDNRCMDLTGKTNLIEVIDLLACATIIISNDSGLMHIAAALNKPQIAIYGSSDPNFTPPLNHKAKILSLHLACSPCFQRQCPLTHLNCLWQISPEKVLIELYDLRNTISL
jgi:heptosyltransferase-2